MNRELVIALFCMVTLVIFLLILLLFKKKDGAFIIDTTDPEKDLYQLRLDTPLQSIPRKKTITLKIEVVENLENDSQKIHSI